MLRGKHHECCPKNRILSRREDGDDFLGILEGEVDFSTDAFPNPVLLHGQNAFGPPGQLLEVLQQLLSVLGYPEKPLVEFLLRHFRVAPPAQSCLHLLVGQHGLARFTPVDIGSLPVGQALFIHPQKKPLFPSIV